MQAKRLEYITKLLEENGSVEVSELSKVFRVTEKTIRQDLLKLEELQIAKRVHGGAMIKKDGSEIFPIVSRKTKHTDEKLKIAQKALSLIEDGDTIILDSGSTTFELAKILNKNVIVITNDPFIAHELMDHEKVTLYTTGGLLSRERGYYVYVGQDAIRTIKSYRAKKCFLGVSGLDFEQGLMVFSTYEQEIKHTILKVSQQAILLADYSKFHKFAFTSYARLDEISCIVTDDKIPPEDIAFLSNKNIKLIIASGELDEQ